MEHIDKMKNSNFNPVMVKLAIIIVMILLLLIPVSMIKSIITERESQNELVTEHVSSKWADKQEIKGPILTIPVSFQTIDKEGQLFNYEKNWYILPDQLNIKGDVSSKSLEKSIYEVIVYGSIIELDGHFDLKKNLNEPQIKEIHYDNAFLTIGVSDLKGIKNQLKLHWNDEAILAQPGSQIQGVVKKGVTVPVKIQQGENYNFKLKMDLQGSQNLSFIPLGATTNVDITSNWTAPSFVGNFLPDNREISSEGFTASWKVLQLNRNFPQEWLDDRANNHQLYMDQSRFGMDLIVPLDDYQKAMRSSKYGIMTIALTFLIFFLVEIMNKTRIHPLQYAMVGLALCLFYILLVSISEHSNFNFAFGISSVGIIGMISLYSLTLFKNKKLSLMLSLILIGIYCFLFTTLQMVDYALLLGGIGLTIILGATMFYTRKINWYQLQIDTN
ncbi:cell envelope integrity protein CreD [Flammeovirga yaeyamensis]|uniref:Cell envelope integrity protein CreD n=3 Tax=Flammeovirga yaeyamensis TaxID=367791 RepID=A0AAX1N1Q0_9BACT|nr:cell envelope integrity protein CreD [Flammeovirga yaeyamensis]MBB3698214.1 inner membrane protein [Flammeovirga yaeyamensis]NMF34431.1 cell envelope integrity protein CreD [Flammeovirga yaeyamensis]QWG01410.1 cell envelope integrity protein CreD [Flammeovirga yaeyamensis]